MVLNVVILKNPSGVAWYISFQIPSYNVIVGT